MPEPVGELSAGCSVCGSSSWTATVDHDVGGARQVEQSLPVRGAIGVEYRAALVGVVHREGDACAPDGGQRGSPLATAGRFDLQHVGAEVGEQAADAVGLCAAQVQNPYRLQQSLGHRFSSRSTHSRWESVEVET